MGSILHLLLRVELLWSYVRRYTVEKATIYELFHIYFRKRKMCSKVTVQDHVKKKDEVLAKTAELCLRDGFNPSFAAQFFCNAG